MSTNNFTLNNGAFSDWCYISEEEDETESTWDYEDAAENFEAEAANINNNLQFFKIGLKSGHYYGFNVLIDSAVSGLDCDELTDSDFTNEDSKYYFGLYRSEAIRKISAEVRKINKFLKTLKNIGFKNFVKIAQFSNGEALYKFKG